MNLLIVSQDQLHADAICGYLNANGILTQVRRSSSHVEASHLIEKHKHDIIILDYNFSIPKQDTSGARLLRMLKVEKATCIALVSNICPMELALWLSSNVNVILHLDEAKFYFQRVHIKEMVHRAYLSPSIRDAIGQSPGKGHALYSLSKTELHMSVLLLQGLSNEEIATKLFKSKLTIDTYRKSIKEKLSVFGGKISLLAYLAPYTQWLINCSDSNTPI